MIYIYLFSLILGGILLVASMLLGGDGDADHDGLADGHLVGHDEPGAVSGLLVAFFSMRFWIFFATFFGLTGVVLDGLGLLEGQVPIALLATGMGSGTGGLAVWVMRRLRGDGSNSAASSADYLGKTGRLLVGVAKGQVGKVRVELRGSTVDLLAVSADDEPIEARTEVIVIELDGTRAKVARLEPSQEESSS